MLKHHNLSINPQLRLSIIDRKEVNQDLALAMFVELKGSTRTRIRYRKFALRNTNEKVPLKRISHGSEYSKA